jgi:hypothetical protein
MLDSIQPIILNIANLLKSGFSDQSTIEANMSISNNDIFSNMNKQITKQTNIIINSLNTTHNNSAIMMLHNLKNIMTTEVGYLKRYIDGALVEHDALLR